MITVAELNQLVTELDLPQAGPLDRARITHSVLVEAAEDLDNRLADHDGRFTRLTVRALKSLSSSPDPAYVQDLIDDVNAAIFQAAKRDEDTGFLRVCLRALEVVKRGRLIEWQIFIQGVALCYAHAALDEGLPTSRPPRSPTTPPQPCWSAP